MKIILGSKSRGRRKVLAEAGFEFEVMPADIDEKAIRIDDYEKLPVLIARAKNDALAATIKEPALLITSDTVTIYRGELREKPADANQARGFLRSYEPDEPITCVTAVAVTNLQTGKSTDSFTKADIYFKKFSDTDIERFIEDGYILHTAGAFAIELELFKPFVDHIDGDPETVIGISTTLVRQLITEVTA